MVRNIIGIDLAKSIFHVCVCNSQGRIISRQRVTANKLCEYLQKQEPSIVAMEACAGAHHWGRFARDLGHEPRLISPQFVKPYVKSQKNDHNDAEAICEAASRPTMRFVPVKSISQQEIQAIHRIRERLLKHRTSLCNQARGFLMEHGIVIAKGRSHLFKKLPELLADESIGLPDTLQWLLQELYNSLTDVQQRIVSLEERLSTIAQSNEHCQRLQTIPGIGPLSATALHAAVGNGRNFQNGRQMAAWLGLVPRQFSTGGIPRLGKISKRGDKYLRKLFVHGARSTAIRAKARKPNEGDCVQQWQQGLLERLPMNKVVVARANKNARIAWAILTRGENYRASK
jgi:transposase